MRELESTNGNEENRLKVKELSTQHKIILERKGLDGTNSDLFVCSLIQSTQKEEQGMCFQVFTL